MRVYTCFQSLLPLYYLWLYQTIPFESPLPHRENTVCNSNANYECLLSLLLVFFSSSGSGIYEMHIDDLMVLYHRIPFLPHPNFCMLSSGKQGRGIHFHWLFDEQYSRKATKYLI